MKLILLQDVENLGSEGDIVTVKDGYGRNFLIPKGFAVMATKGAEKALQEELRQKSRKIAQKKEDAQRIAAELENMEISVPARVGEENRIFGTVTPQQVAIQLAHQGFDVDRRKIEMNEEIRMIGVYSATVRLHPEVTAQLKVRVVPENEAAA